MQKHTRSQFHWFAASILLIGIAAMAPAGIVNAASYLATGHWDFDQGDLRATLGTDLHYGDGDGEADNEVNTVYVNSLQFRDGSMTADQVLALGAATASGIPIPVTSNPTQPTLAFNRTGTTVTISWNPAIIGFSLESAASLSAPTWAPVANVANNSVAITSGAGNQFFRLKKP